MPDTPIKAKRRVFLVDDHPMVREHLTVLLQREPDLEVCGEAADGASALCLIPLREPDLVILDLSLKVSDGLELLKELRTLRPGLPVLILSMHDEPLFAERALRAGALGYITKAEATVNILAAIRMVLAKGTYVSDSILGRLIRKIEQVLTPLETEIFRLSSRGLDAGQIGRQLRLDTATIEAHCAWIGEKLLPLNRSPLFPHAVQRFASFETAPHLAHRFNPGSQQNDTP